MQQESCTTCDSQCSENGCCTGRVRDIIADSGGRVTKERLALLRTICKYDGHFTPEDLQHAMENIGSPMALTTIYRNIPLLQRAGIIRKTSVLDESEGGATTYEHIWGKEHHDHMVCLECGERIEFKYPALEVLQEAVAKEYGFTLVTHHMELMGMCHRCYEKQLRSSQQESI